jgi:hypothetical protein
MNHAVDTLDATRPDRATLRNQIESLVARLHPPIAQERRHDDRVAIPVLFRLTPLDSNRTRIEAQATIVIGKNVSRRGLSFYHELPIPQRRALIELAHPDLGSFAAEIDVSWCRFTKPGWYESGGRLIRCVAQDSDEPNPQQSPFALLTRRQVLDLAAVPIVPMI